MSALPRLHVIADESAVQRADFADSVRAICSAAGSAAALHLRAHRLSGRAFHERAVQLGDIAAETGVVFVVNDRIDVALAERLGDVILGTRSIPVADARRLLGAGARIGYSAHAVAESIAAARSSADWLMLGTIYETASHPGRTGAGVELIEDVSVSVDVPVVAIGGITPERAAEARAAGAHGVAVLTGIWNAGDPGAAVAAYLAALV